MNPATIVEPDWDTGLGHQQITLPQGLLGFESQKHFTLQSNPGEQPFAWLKTQEPSALAFVVLNPWLADPGYHPEIPDADASFLGIHSPEDAEFLGIVTLKGSGHATMNLKGPIIINRHSGLGKQVILANATEYSVHHPLPVAA